MIVISLLFTIAFACKKSDLVVEKSISKESTEILNFLKKIFPYDSLQKLDFATIRLTKFKDSENVEKLLFAVKVKERNEYLLYAKYKTEEIIKWITIERESNILSRYSNRVIVKNADYSINKEIIIEKKEIKASNSLKKQRPSSVQDPLPEVAVYAFIPKARRAFEYWNLYYLLSSTAFYNDFHSFEYEIEYEGSGGNLPTYDNSTEAPSNNPCDQMNELADNQDFILNMNDLAGSLATTHEHGFAITRNSDGLYSFSDIKGRANEPYINYNFNSKSSIGFIHTHYNGLNSMPSPDDLRQFGKIFATYSGDNRNQISSEFTLAVVSQYGSYVLKIDDYNKFLSFYANKLLNNSDLINFNNQYTNTYLLNSSNAINSWENNFLKLLKDYNTGLKLYRGNANNSQWSELVYNSFGDDANTGNCITN